MPAAIQFAGSFAGPARVALSSPSPASRVLAAVAAATLPATTSGAAPRIVPVAERVPLSQVSPAARVVALAQQAVPSSAPVYRPSGPVGVQTPTNRLRGPIFAAAAPPPPSSIAPFGPVYASPAAFSPSFAASGYSSDDDGAAWDVPTYAAAPAAMQTRSMLGVEAPTSVWWIVAGAGVAAVAYHLYRRDFAGRRP